MLQGSQSIICDPKLKIYKKFWTAIPRNKQNMFICSLPFFEFLLNKLCWFHVRIAKLSTSRGIFRALFSFWWKVNSSRGIFRTESNIKDEAFWEKHFQPFIIYTKSAILDGWLHFEHPSGTISYFHKRLHLDVCWLGFRYTSDMLKNDGNCKKPVNELYLEMLHLRLWNNF